MNRHIHVDRLLPFGQVDEPFDSGVERGVAFLRITASRQHGLLSSATGLGLFTGTNGACRGGVGFRLVSRVADRLDGTPYQPLFGTRQPFDPHCATASAAGRAARQNTVINEINPLISFLQFKNRKKRFP